MQVEEIILCIKGIIEAVVQAFWQLHERQEVHMKPLWPMCVLQQATGREYIYLLLYIDDMLIAFKSWFVIDKLKKDLSFEFEMKDLGEAKKVLGKKIERDWESCKVSLRQKEYVWTHILHNCYCIPIFIL